MSALTQVKHKRFVHADKYIRFRVSALQRFIDENLTWIWPGTNELSVRQVSSLKNVRFRHFYYCTPFPNSYSKLG